MDTVSHSQSQGTLLSLGELSLRSIFSRRSEKTEEEKQKDLEKNNVASPVDMESYIQKERITKILDEALYKTKLAICLPELVRDYKILNSILSPQHMDDLVYVFEQYGDPLYTTSMLNVFAMKDIRSGEVSLKERLNPELAHIIHILNSYPSLIEHVHQMIDKMINDYSETNKNNTEPQAALEYLFTLERFRDIMVTRMETSAAEELQEKLNIKKMELSNEKLKANISELTEKLNREQAEFSRSMKDKTDLIANLKKELKVLEVAAEAKLKKKVLNSDHQMALMFNAHNLKNEMLKEEELEIRENYNNTLRRHLTEEKQQRARRFKAQTQLLSWLQKYDTEMTDKEHEHDELQRKFDEETKRCELLTKKLKEQEVEYIPLIKERDDEYHAEMMKKMEAFRLERACRIIQNGWRQVLINRSERKKLIAQVKKLDAKKEKMEKEKEVEQKKEKKFKKKGSKNAAGSVRGESSETSRKSLKKSL